MFSIPDVEICQELFESMPIAICRVDAENVITWANKALGEILDWGPDEIIGRQVEGLFVSPDDASAFVAAIQEQGSVAGESVRLWTMHQGILMASASAFEMTRPDGSYDGWVGTLVEDYKRILDYVPAGICEVLSEDGRDTLSYCNREFARMFGFSSDREPRGRDIREFYLSEDDYVAFGERLRSQDAQGQPLRDYTEWLRTQQDRQVEVQVSACLIKDCCDQVTGCLEFVQDITDERQLRAQLEDLKRDVGRVFHTYSSALSKIGHVVRSTLWSMEPAPFASGERPSIDQINKALVSPVARLGYTLQGLITAIETDWQERGLGQEQWQELGRFLEFCLNYERVVAIPEFRPDALRLAAHSVIDFLDGLAMDRLPNVPVKAALRAARDVERVACFALLCQAQSEVTDMDAQARALRSYVTSGTRSEDENEAVEFWTLVNQALDMLADHAQAMGIEYDSRNEARGVRVRVVESDIVRALGNILHNAIKYSWSRTDGRRPWVTVRSFVSGSQVGVEFENRGVPIPRDEIEEGLIFRLGYRGRLSGDRGRLGTGIGLTDARQTARRHGGDVEVDSRPAWRDAEPEDYSVPYITTVTLWLPLHSG